MKKEGENLLIIDFKRKAKHLHTMLKPRIPDLRLGQCFDYLARLYGARNWQELKPRLKEMGSFGDPKK